MSEEDTTHTLFMLLLEDIVMDNNPHARELFFLWQPREAAEAAIILARAMTPCRLLMPGNPASPEPFCDEVSWHYVDDEMPDDETRVMIALDEEYTEEPDFGYHAEGKWWFDDEPDFAPREAQVYAWAHVIGIPPRRGGVS